MTDKNPKSLDFSGLGIEPKLMEIIYQLRFTMPTPIQHQSIPITIEGKDLVGIAQTGTGKTLAFAIPIIQRLAKLGGRALILLPTRELAMQVNESFQLIGKAIGLRTAVLIGGQTKSTQIRDLSRNPHVIIATPGRLIDYLQTKAVNLQTVKILVLDEADLMFDMGFIPQITEILKSVPKQRQPMLFSATMPPAIMKIVTSYMQLPVRIEVAPSGTPAEKVIHEMILIKREDRFDQLRKILNNYHGSILIFGRTKHGVRNLTKKINQMGQVAAEIHSGRSLPQRTTALKGFKTGQFRILVATDIAARGIDVKGIELVLNFDLPGSSEDYVHRIGRTGRAGKPGLAITFVSPNEMAEVKDIERLIKQSIPMTKLAEPEADSNQSRSKNRRRPYFQPGQPRGQGAHRSNKPYHKKFNRQRQNSWH